jgi:hypothetical protein
MGLEDSIECGVKWTELQQGIFQWRNYADGETHFDVSQCKEFLDQLTDYKLSYLVSYREVKVRFELWLEEENNG